MPQIIDITGQRFGRLTAIRIVPPRTLAQRSKWWMCRCDCGQEIIANGANIRYGITQSCGCLRTELLTKRNTFHGLSRTHEYRIWKSMKARCFNTKGAGYRHYGGRGITVCPQWRYSFETFLNDMGKCPTERGKRSAYSIDRIDNDGDYTPTNCRWTTQTIQVRNSRKARLISHNGETLCLKDWAHKLGITESSLRERLLKWPIRRALGVMR